MCGGVSPEAPQAPPPSWKNHVTAKIVRVAANILHVVADISRAVADKAVEEAKTCWPLKFFSIFWGFSMVKIHFFQKVFKKWSSFRKKLLHFFPLPLGGSDPKVEIFTLFFYFFWTLPLMIVAHPFSSIHDVTMTAAVLPRLAAWSRTGTAVLRMRCSRRDDFLCFSVHFK